MYKSIFFTIVALIKITLTAQTVEASVDPKIHKQCLNAKDYKGCIKINSNQSQGYKNQEKDNCFGYKNAVEAWCLAGSGKDFLGEEKIKGWAYKEVPEHKMVLYINPTLSQLKVDNSYGRYLIKTSILRSFRKFIADRPMQQTTVGGTKTDCSISGYGSSNIYGDAFGDTGFNNRFRSLNNFYGSMKCNTSSPETMWIPGQIGQSEGVDQDKYHDIIDCDKREFANITSKIVSNKTVTQLSNWNPVAGVKKSLASKGCKDYMLLPLSNNLEYEKIKIRK